MKDSAPSWLLAKDRALPILCPASSRNTETFFDEPMSIPTNKLEDIIDHTPFFIILAKKGIPGSLKATASLKIRIVQNLWRP